MPFTEVVTQMPLYAKFLKEILSKKRIIEEKGVVNLTDCYLQCCDKEEFTIKDERSRKLHHSLHHWRI